MLWADGVGGNDERRTMKGVGHRVRRTFCCREKNERPICVDPRGSTRTKLPLQKTIRGSSNVVEGEVIPGKGEENRLVNEQYDSVVGQYLAFYLSCRSDPLDALLLL